MKVRDKPKPKPVRHPCWSKMTTTAQTEAALRDWRTDNNDLCSLIQQHYELLKPFSWLDIGDAHQRLFNLMLAGEHCDDTGHYVVDPLEPDSVELELVQGAALAGYYCGLRTVARALGLNDQEAERLRKVVDRYSYHDEPEPPLTIEQFVAEVKK